MNHLFFSEEALQLDSTYSTLLLGEGFRLYSTNSQKDFPLVTTDFQMGFENHVCIDTTQAILPFFHYPLWQKEFFFPKDGCPTKISSALSYLDLRYVHLASQPFLELLESNGLQQYSSGHGLDLFEYLQSQPEQFDVDLLFRPRIHYNPECLMPNGTPASSLFQLSEGSDSSLTLSAITGSFLMILIAAILGFTGIIFKNFCSRKRTRRKLMMWILSAIMCVFALSLIPVITLLHRVNRVDHSFFQGKLDEGMVCGDRYVQAIIDGVVSGYIKTRGITIALIVFIVLSCVAWVVFVIFKVISSEDEYQTRTQSSRDHSMKIMYIMPTLTENERYTNQPEGSTKENALAVNDDDEDTWADNRIASYIPQNIFINDDDMNSMDSEIKMRPVIKSRILGASKIIMKSPDKDHGSEEYYHRKQRRKKKNEKLRKRLNKQKGFEMIHSNNSRKKKKEEGDLSDDPEKSQIDKEFRESKQTITIMSPVHSMDESEIIAKQVVDRVKPPAPKSKKKLEIDIENHNTPGLQDKLIKSPLDNEMKFTYPKDKSDKTEETKIDFDRKQKEIGLNEPMNLFKKERPKRSTARSRNEAKSRNDRIKESRQNEQTTERKSRGEVKRQSRQERKSRGDKERQPRQERKSRDERSKKSSMIGKSIMSKKVDQPKEASFDISQEPQEMNFMGKSIVKSRGAKSDNSEGNSKPLRRSRKSRKDRSVHSSNSSVNDQDLIFGKKAFGKKPRERRRQGEERTSRKSRRPKKEGSLLSQISRN